MLERTLALFLVLIVTPGLGADDESSDSPVEKEATSDRETNDATPKVLTVDDYGRWNRISSVTLSRDGSWMSYAYLPNDGDGTLHLKRLDGEGAHEVERGSRPAFSPDASFAVCFVDPKGKEDDGGGRRGSRRRGQDEDEDEEARKLRLLRLADGDTVDMENASSFRFSEDATWLAIHMTKGDREAKHDGRDLLLRELETGRTRNLGNVSEFAFNESSTHLAYVVSAAGRHGNGLYLLDLATDHLRALDTASHDYSRLRWDEEWGDALAVLRGEVPDQRTRRVNTLLVYPKVIEEPDRVVTITSDAEGIPDGFVISELASVSFREERGTVLFGIKEQADKIEKEKDRPDVDVWHWNDERVQSVQARQARRDRDRTYRCIVHLDDRGVTRLEDDRMRSVSVPEYGPYAVGRDNELYRREVTWGGARADYYRVDLRTGERKLITEALGRSIGSSPDGEWFVFLKSGRVWSYHLADGTLTDLSPSAPVQFVNEDDDHPYEKPSFGVAGWIDDDAVVLNHRHDLWRVELDGTGATNLTGGLGRRAADPVPLRHPRP